MPTGYSNQIFQNVDARLNKADDAAIGQSVSSGTGAQRFLGQLGAKLYLGPSEVRYDSATGTLYGGIYQYVQTKAASTIAPARGLLCYWVAATPSSYVVTPDDQGGTADIAGVYLNAPTKGNYCWIQIAGVASVKCIASLTRTAGIGDVGIAVAATADVDNIDSNDALNGDNVNAIACIFIEAPSNGAIKLARLWAPRWNF